MDTQQQNGQKANTNRLGCLIALVCLLGVGVYFVVFKILPTFDRWDWMDTISHMRNIGTSLGSYQVDYGHYPLQQPEAVFSSEILPTYYYNSFWRDSWETEYRYVSNGQSYTLISYGKDQKKDKTPALFPFSARYNEDIIFSNGEIILPPGVSLKEFSYRGSE